MRNCKRCEGKCSNESIGKVDTCRYCNGTGVFAEVLSNEIEYLIISTKGKNKGKLKSSMVSPSRSDGLVNNRAYYVWRMARFHGGIDTTMPVMAGLCIRHDPYIGELDILADKLAVDSFGSNMAAAHRWSRAFGA